MIPFTRILNYANIAPGLPSIKKILSYNTRGLILLENGDLYAHGVDNDYLWGGSTALNITGDIVLSAQDVVNFWTGYVTFAHKTDGKMYATGSLYCFHNENTIQQGFTDVSQYFSAFDISNIKNIIAGYTVFVLLNDGKLYGRGYNRNGSIGNGTKTFVSDWVLMSENVKSVFGDAGGDTCFIVKNDNTIWGAGNNNSLQINDQPGDKVTFTEVLKDISFTPNTIYYNNGIIVISTDNIIHVTGTSNTGVSGLSQKSINVGFNIGDMSKFYNDNISPSPSRLYLHNSDTNKLVSTGYSPINSQSSNNLPYFESWKEVDFSSYNTNMSYSGGTYINYFWSGNKIWMSGYPPSSMAGKNYSICQTPLSYIISEQTDLPF
ncbi:hypothetical protein ACUYQI_000537 [Salmonella enterica subsp. enterica serovar Braenderup]